MSDVSRFIDRTVPPSGTGCVECDRMGSWWLHLRRCAACGHVGCCDNSLNRHASAHFTETGHRIVQSFEPDEDWSWDYLDEQFFRGLELAPPSHHPLDQSVPGPAERVPGDWREQLGAT
ncbi:MAG TPA: UBP-type zinc finger domain-containing protein [Microbacterium sp.]|uniref:UBP-type zinc finger domain-containing protein n=1 Tax=Microbacterium sp. TaxID=51671 RepID=UPI002BD7E4B5|nr:UBP-type zinc finger domain-containing protein [Microbacterium sp.]HWI30302.1 UBP-type zinc finger domain-containing protein [Microbacterium sp.]